MTDTKPTVVEALAAVAEGVRAIRKTDYNKHSSYNFRGIDAVMNAVGPEFRKHGVVCIPSETLDLHQETVQTTTGKPTLASKVHVRYRFYGPAGDYIDAEVWGESWDSSDKGLAQAYSVAYRTALLQALTIPTDSPDPDSQTLERAEDPGLPGELVAAFAVLPEDARARINKWVAGKGGGPVADLPSSWVDAITEAVEKEAAKVAELEPVS